MNTIDIIIEQNLEFSEKIIDDKTKITFIMLNNELKSQMKEAINDNDSEEINILTKTALKFREYIFTLIPYGIKK